MPLLIRDIISKFNQPFPEKRGFKKVILTGLCVGLFITTFLYFFRPFGFNKLKYSPEVFTLIFGLITFATIVLFEAFTAFVLNIKKDTDEWTLWKWIVETIILIFLISIGNYFFVLDLLDGNVGDWGFANMIFSTFTVGIFPMVFSGLLMQLNALKRNQKKAESVTLDIAPDTATHQTIKLRGQNGDQELEFSSQDLLFIEAKSNYVTIHLHRDDHIKEERLRSTIKNIQSQLSSELAMRCHRSFIVNPNKVNTVTGNAQGLRLSLDGLSDLKIPVSRSYIPPIKARLSST